MIEKLLIESIPLITTSLSLVAFLAAAVVLMHARTVGRAEKLISKAPENERATLVAGALDILDVRSRDLTKEQRYELALEILSQRRHRNVMIFILSTLIAVSFASITIYSFTKKDLAKDVEKILTVENREEVMPILNKSGIFSAEDEHFVDYLASKSSLPDDLRRKMSESEYDLEMEKKYNSIASVKELRRRASEKKEPFTVLGEEISASVPDRVDHPRQFFAHVPMESRFANRVVTLSGQSGRYVRVFARGAIDSSYNQTKIHINKEQAIYLAGAFPMTGALNLTIKETVQGIYDPNCSIHGRSLQMARSAEELCAQGDSVSISYLQNFMSRY
ncbi:MAG: hypothetical protein J0M09_14900 [Xanthomonadales bacterium]|nr:hypothetical protein [Xanthomonadales bacterium]